MYLIFLCLVFGSLSCLVEDTFCQILYNDIYDGQHLKDVLFSPSSGRTIRHLVLVVHKPECQEQVDAWIQMHKGSELPSDSFVMFAVHDYETSKHFTWYKWRSADDLTSWYNMTLECVSVGFLPRGSTEDTKLVFLDDHINFKDWIWNHVRVDVMLANNADENVVFTFHHGSYKHIPDVTVLPGETKKLKAFTSYMLSATGRKGFYGGWTFGYGGRTIYVHIATDLITEEEFLSKEMEIKAQRQTKLQLQIWSDLSRHLLIRKQPLLVKYITSTGFKKLPIPTWIHEQLVQYYDQHKEFREMESLQMGSTVINMDQQKCGSVNLDAATRAVVASAMRPLLEEWCNCKLTMTSFFGIREYYNGHLLKNHVDLIATHVISVILQVAQDLGDASDWELEIITFDGDHKNVQLKAGEMLFYESARLIHGRPKPFQGKLMANAFLHFKPTEGWHFDRLDGQLYDDGIKLAPIHPLSDHATLAALQSRNREYVGRAVQQSMKDEL